MKGKFVQSLDMTLPAELFVNPPSGRFSMALLTDLLNLDLSSLTDKIIAEYIWIGGSGMDLRSKARAVDLKTQLQYFRDLQKQFRQELGDSKAAELLSDAVYLFSCGGNDYLSPVQQREYSLPIYERFLVSCVIGKNDTASRVISSDWTNLPFIKIATLRL